MPLAGILGFRREWMFAVLYGLMLLIAEGIVLRKAESAIAQGILIATSFAFLMDAGLGFVLRNRLLAK